LAPQWDDDRFPAEMYRYASPYTDPYLYGFRFPSPTLIFLVVGGGAADSDDHRNYPVSLPTQHGGVWRRAV